MKTVSQDSLNLPAHHEDFPEDLFLIEGGFFPARLPGPVRRAHLLWDPTYETQEQFRPINLRIVADFKGSHCKKRGRLGKGHIPIKVKYSNLVCAMNVVGAR